MSEFACEVVRVKIEPHPNADAIEIARVGDYQSIVKKGQLRDGDLAVYIPEQAVVPEWLLREMGMYDDERKKGGLAGSLGNRVKAIKLRGVLSQGLILTGVVCQLEEAVELCLGGKYIEGEYEGDGYRELGYYLEGQDAAEFLGITKYEPALPSHMRGKAIGVDLHATAKYDFENIKKNPKLFEDGEDVVITEKIHGTLLMIGVVPESDANEKYYRGRVTISSKGLGGRGIVLDHTDETNIYAQAVNRLGLLDKAFDMFGDASTETSKAFFMFGEVYGKTLGGKDVQEGFSYGSDTLEFRAFDMCAGSRGGEEYLDWVAFKDSCHIHDIPMVPVLYEGPYSREVLNEHTDGYTVVHGAAPRGHEKPAHIREGVVVKACDASCHPHYGRKIAKSISEAYLLRDSKNATEYS